MNEFETYMGIREKVSDLVDAIEDIQDEKQQLENLEYAIKMLQDLRNEKIQSEL